MMTTTSRLLAGALCALALAVPALAQSTYPNKPGASGWAYAEGDAFFASMAKDHAFYKQLIAKLGLKDKP